MNSSCLSSSGILITNSKIHTWFHENAPDQHAKASTEHLTTTELKLFDYQLFSQTFTRCKFTLFMSVPIMLKEILLHI